MRRLFVANAGEDTISVICPERIAEIDRIPLKSDSRLGTRCIAARDNRLILANSFNNSVSSFDLLTGKNEFTSVGVCPGSMCEAADSWLVACAESNSVWQLSDDLQPMALASLGRFPFIVSCSGENACVIHLTTRDAVIFDPKALVPIKTIHLPGNPFGGIITHDAVMVSQSLKKGGAVDIYEFGGELRARILLDEIPGRLLRFGDRVIAANYWGKGIFVLDIDSSNCVDYWETSCMPDDMIADDETGRLFISCMMEDTVDVLSFGGERIACIPVGREPRGMAKD